MNTRMWILGVAAIVLGGSLLAWADKTKDKDALDPMQLQKSGEILPQAAILERAKAQTPGKIVETELERKHGRYVYEVEVIGDDGVKTELKYDAKTGELISSKVEKKTAEDEEDDDDD